LGAGELATLRRPFREVELTDRVREFCCELGHRALGREVGAFYDGVSMSTSAPRRGRAGRSGAATMLSAMSVATLTFADRLAAEAERTRSQLIVGLDPHPDLLPVELRDDVARFCCGIVDAVAPHAVAVKPQLAFFEALGPEGMAAFAEVCDYARRAGMLVIA